MKRILKSTLSIVLAFAFVFSAVYSSLAEISFVVDSKAATSGYIDDAIVWELGDDGVLNVFGVGEIPNFSAATETPWYGLRDQIKSLVIGDEISVIGNNAFRGLTTLESVTIPFSITKCGLDAFGGDVALKAVYADDVRSWCNTIFANSTSNPVCYGNNLYFDGELVTDLVIAEGVETIKNNTFINCKSLKSLVVSDCVKKVGQWAFQGCSELETVKLVNNVEVIGMFAFNDCISLKTVSLNDGLTMIDQNGFGNCWELENVVIPDSVSELGQGAFCNNRKLKSVQLPLCLVSLGAEAFSGCSSLGEIAVPEGITTINDGTFYGCSNLKSVVLPDGIDSIGKNAFYECISLEEFKVPYSVSSFGYRAFYGCTGLKAVYTEILDRWFNISFDDQTANPLCYATKLYYNDKLVTEISVPKGVSKINSYAFFNAKSIKSFNAPYSLETIGENAFYGCTALESVRFGKALTQIRDFAFNDCISLVYVYFAGTQEEWDKVEIGNYNAPLLKLGVHIGSESHVESDWIVSKAATCVEVGTKYKVCLICDQVVETAEIPLADHTPSDWITDKKATVNAAGKKHKECTECGKVLETATIKQLKCSAVTLSKVANVATGVRVYWSKVTGADSYRVYRKVKGGSYKVIGNTTKAYYTDTTAKSGTVYYYSVRAINEAGLGAVCKTAKSIKCLADPTLKVPTSSRSGITLKWTKTTGASGYVIYRKAGNGSWKKLVTEKGVSNLSYVDKTAKKGTTYTYKVRAYYGSTYSAYSNTRQIKDKY